MQIDKEFLPFIFNDDIIYIDRSEVAEADTAENASNRSLEKNAAEPIKDHSAPVQDNEAPAKVMVLLDNKTAEAEESLLVNILKAVNLSNDEVDRIYEHPTKFSHLKGTKLILAFHNNYAPKSNYEINTVNDIQVIYAHSLSELNQNISYKKQLWANLKKIEL